MYEVKPLGIIHSPFKHKEDVPLRGFENAVGEIEVFKEYEEGLKDIDGFSHIVVLWIFHESKSYNLLVKPLAHKSGFRGVFATGHPDRPNHIGLTILELLNKNGNILKVKGIDMADKSPIVDIKPYGSKYIREKITEGWEETAERR